MSLVGTILNVLAGIAPDVKLATELDPNLLKVPVVASIANVVDEFPVELANFKAGQAVVVATGSVDGDAATTVIFRNGGAAASSLGL